MNQPTESEFLDDVGLKKPDRSASQQCNERREVAILDQVTPILLLVPKVTGDKCILTLTLNFKN